MTFLKFFFWTVCVLCLVLAFRFGERDEKRGMTIIAVGSVVTAVVATIANLNHWDVALFILFVDICVLISFVRVMFESQKFWPIWIGSLQSISVVINILDVLAFSTLPAAYDILQGFWVYPMFLAIMAGTYGSRKARLRNQGAL
jgi:uncharacterized membrane protein